MRLKRLLSPALAICLTAALCIGGMSVSAATAFPDMPKGAENLFNPDSMELLGETKLAATYENNTLLLQPRSGTDPAWASLTAKFDLPDAVKTAANGFVIQFHTRIARGSDNSKALYVRFSDAGSNDMFGAYYDMVLTSGKASLYYGRVEKIPMTLPSTGKALTADTDKSIMGDWREVSLYLRKNGASYDLTTFINREAVVAADGSDTVAVEDLGLCLMFGFQGYSAPLRGLRVYAVDPNASSFEPAFDPDAEFSGAEDGTAGKDGGNGGVTLIGDEPEAPQDSDKPADDKDTDAQEPPVDNDPSPLPIILGVAGSVLVAAVVVVVLIVLKKRKAAPAPTDEKEADEDEKV